MTGKAINHPLREWRISKGLTLEAAAGLVGTSKPVWHCWETGKRKPNATFMPLIREATEGAISADDFFPSFGRAA